MGQQPNRDLLRRQAQDLCIQDGRGVAVTDVYELPKGGYLVEISLDRLAHTTEAEFWATVAHIRAQLLELAGVSKVTLRLA